MLAFLVLMDPANDIKPNHAWFTDAIYIGVSGIFGLILFQIMIYLATVTTMKGKVKAADESIRMLKTDLCWVFIARMTTAIMALISLGILYSVRLPNNNWFLIPAVLAFASEVLGRFIFYGQYRRVGY